MGTVTVATIRGRRRDGHPVDGQRRSRSTWLSLLELRVEVGQLRAQRSMLRPVRGDGQIGALKILNLSRLE
jgi:hypothetical protein